MKVISLVNQKGGCGKTTTAVNLAYALSLKGKKTLLVDLDPQAHATFALGIEPQATITDVFEDYVNSGAFNLDQRIIERNNNFYVLPSSIGLSAMEQALANRSDKIEILNQFTKQIQNLFDYCIIDCPPNLGILTLNALSISDTAIAPIGICELSLKGVDNLKSIISLLAGYKGKTPSLFYLVTQFDKRYRFSQEFLKNLKKQHGSETLKTMIRTNISLREATACGLCCAEYKKNARGTQDYYQLACEIESLTKKVSWVKIYFKGVADKNVYITGEFANWAKNDNYKLKKIDSDTWVINLPFPKGEYRYKFIVDGKWISDPNNKKVESDSYGGTNSIFVV